MLNGPTSYIEWSKTPLASLALLTPLLVFHELSLLTGSGPAGQAETVIAYRMIERVVSAFGLAGAALPAIVTVGILIGLHVMSRAPSRLRYSALGVMFIEALLWAVPLFLLQAIIGRALLSAPETGAFAEQSLLPSLNLAIGAGLYEELVFRLMLVGGGVWVLEHLMAVRPGHASIWVILISAVAFSLYHHPFGSGGTSDERFGLFVLYAVGGVYFGVTYLTRGFGITAGAHAAYDIWVIALAGGAAGSP